MKIEELNPEGAWMFFFLALEALIPFALGSALGGAIGLVIGARHHEARMGAIKGAMGGLCGSIVGLLACYGYMGWLESHDPQQIKIDELGFGVPGDSPAWYVPWLFLFSGVLLFSAIYFADLQMRLKAEKATQDKPDRKA